LESKVSPSPPFTETRFADLRSHLLFFTSAVFFLWGATCTLCIVFTYFLGESIARRVLYSLALRPFVDARLTLLLLLSLLRHPVPETKGLSLEQVDLLYRESSVGTPLLLPSPTFLSLLCFLSLPLTFLFPLSLFISPQIIKSNAYRKQMLANDETFLHHDTPHGHAGGLEKGGLVGEKNGVAHSGQDEHVENNTV
jgi:hypothetical protein